MPSTKLSLAAALLAASALSCSWSAFTDAPDEAEAPDPPAVEPTAQPIAAPAPTADEEARGPLLIIGVDALDLEVLRPLVAAGRVPTFARLLELGAHGVLYSEREIRSPALWTTIATGRPRAVHGIYDFVTGSRLWPDALRSKEQRLVTSSMRRVPALWGLASDAGKSVAVVGWLNTWPAEDVNGVMVSPYVALGDRKQVTIKGAIYADETDQVSPAERWEELRPLIVDPDDVPEATVRRLAGPVPAKALEDLPILQKYEHALRWSLAHTLTVGGIGRHLLERDAPDLTMVYFEGSDSLAHRFWLFRSDPAQIASIFTRAGLPTDHVSALREAYQDVVGGYYQVVDEVIGELIEALPQGGRVLIVSDHGFGDRTEHFPLNVEVPFTGEHHLEGTILLAGPGVSSGARLYGATIYDVAPTALSLLGVPSSIPFEGQALASRVASETAGADGVADAVMEAPFAADEIDRLRSLGYVQ